MYIYKYLNVCLLLDFALASFSDNMSFSVGVEYCVDGNFLHTAATTTYTNISFFSTYIYVCVSIKANLYTDIWNQTNIYILELLLPCYLQVKLFTS